MFKPCFLQDLYQIKYGHEKDIWSLIPDVDYPSPDISGLLGEYGLSHGNAAWCIRTNKEIVQVFSSLQGVESNDLVCSFDAVGYSPDDIP